MLAVRSGWRLWPATLGEDSATIEEVCEPFLIQQGFLQRTARGRTATPLAYKHLNREFKGVIPELEMSTEDLL